MLLKLIFLLLYLNNGFCEDISYIEGSNQSLEEALQFLRKYDREASAVCFRVTSAQWSFSTNITTGNHKKMVNEQTIQDRFQRISWGKATSFAWSRLPDPMVRRQMRILATRGRCALHDDQFQEIQRIIAQMKETYSKSTACPYNVVRKPCDLSLEPSLTRILARSRDYDELAHVWKSWRDAVGPAVRQKFIRYVQLANQAARLNGFYDAGEQMRSFYEVSDFEDNLMEIWNSIEPFYREIHAYVRRKLIEHYGPERIRADGPIPAHLLGNMWAQNWKNIEDLVLPFPGKLRGDITPELLRQGYNPLRCMEAAIGSCRVIRSGFSRGIYFWQHIIIQLNLLTNLMFQVAEEFFISLGMKPMPVEFWRHSMLEKPIGREVVCRASAWDFCNKIDYRIKQCTEVTMEDFLTIHHEMAHIQYYLQYAEQPHLFRDGANPAFHEAVGDVIGLSVQTPRHLQRLGLLNNITDDYETNINFLISMALEKVVYLPYAYIVDKWRWNIFTEGVRNMNAKWWELRLHYQGLIPPVLRTEFDFDPSSKYHIIADTPYIRYFLSIILQFQLYESLCDVSGHYGQLHTCDFYRSREAGRLLSEILQLGTSRPWPEVMSILSRGRTRKFDGKALLKYFEPLILWLRVQNRKELLVGWTTGPQDTALFSDWYRSGGESVNLRFHLIVVTILPVFFWQPVMSHFAFVQD